MSEKYLREARSGSRARLAELRKHLGQAERLVAGKACVYATGSFGRLEAGSGSDLDLFIVVDTTQKMKRGKKIKAPSLDGLEQIKLKYYLIDAVERLGIPKFDGGGKYLKVHTVKDFTGKLGSQEDDYENTLTGRLLMLLESKPLLGEEFYATALNAVISAYFVDYEENKDRFVPAFLINDIMRMWRTFCVNYEHYRKKGTIESKVKNLKLKYSRMLTCYSAILYLLAAFVKNATVSPGDVNRMVRITPTERLETISQAEFWGPEEVDPDLAVQAHEALALYSAFLELVHKDEEELAAEYSSHESEWRARSHEFGEKLAALIRAIAYVRDEPSPLYRFILI